MRAATGSSRLGLELVRRVGPNGELEPGLELVERREFGFELVERVSRGRRELVVRVVLVGKGVS